MEVAELKMLGVTRVDKIRNEYIRGTSQVGRFGEKTREARLRWYGHLRRKPNGGGKPLWRKKKTRCYDEQYDRDSIF